MLTYVDIEERAGEKYYTRDAIGRVVRNFVGFKNSPKVREELRKELEREFRIKLEDITTTKNIQQETAAFKVLYAQAS